VKTTQPRRYLVRPNQGLIAGGASEQVTIMLVEKDKNSLLQSYESLGSAALEHCKDKFLVQSTVVSHEEAESLGEYDQLTALWTKLQSGGSSTANATANKKLHVLHKVAGSQAVAPEVAAAVANPEQLSKDQLVAEISNLRRKYDELVAFSVNLTAERDVLNNTLEQTKRDLNREMSSNKNKGIKTAGGNAAAPPSGFGLATVLFVCLAAVLVGAKLQQMGMLPAALTGADENLGGDEF